MGYINENGFFIIFCIVKGRNIMIFQWYKDDMQIDFFIFLCGGYVIIVYFKIEGIICFVLYYI